ncbi:MAG: histidine kinase [Chitinophagaceae bacterium]|nr:histidine kinase [Chitinophagaceae bacterium]
MRASHALRFLLLFTLLNFTTWSRAQTPKSDSWQSALQNKKATIIALWYDLEPFIYQDKAGRLHGVEFDLMESFKPFLKNKYGIDLTIEWVKGQGFESVFNKIRISKEPGIVGWSYFSVTPDRKKEVSFTPAYMPDLNVIITNTAEPDYSDTAMMLTRLKQMQGYTMINTSMEQDIEQLHKRFNISNSLIRKGDDYEVMQNIADNVRGYAYMPLSVYLTGLQKGIRIRRQELLTSRREGIAGILPINSDWKEIINEYFTSSSFKFKTSMTLSNYLGSEVKELVMEEYGNTMNTAADMSLVSLEKNIVTRRLLDSALEVQEQRFARNIMLLVAAFMFVVGLLMYTRVRAKNKMNKQLEEQNLVIRRQNAEIEQMNQLLKLKVLQARMNPHFIFNSLNALQYFIVLDDKKASLNYLSRFSHFLRKVIQSGDELSISVEEEVELVREYLWLEQARFPGKFEYEVNLASNVHQRNILPLLTHGLVEDALYRGVLNLTDNNGKIVIDIREVNDKLIVQVQDNGVSRETSLELEKKKGLIANEETMFARRIRLFNQQSLRKIDVHRSIEIACGVELNTAIIGLPQPLFQS